MSQTLVCDECDNAMPIGTSCPHCGRPQLFPNVQCAISPSEREKLGNAYESARNASAQTELLDQFEERCKTSQALFNWPILKLHRQVASETDVFSTYYPLERLRLRYGVNTGHDWARLRPQAEIELLGSERYIEELHYACLSLDGKGLTSYGECSIELAEEMIAHRTSCFSGNTAVIYAEQRDFSGCLRSDWQNRHKLCIAFCGSRVDNVEKAAELPACLLEVGTTSVEDHFVELHVFGSLTAKSLHTVQIAGSNLNSKEKALAEASRETLVSHGIPVVVLS